MMKIVLITILLLPSLAQARGILRDACNFTVGVDTDITSASTVICQTPSGSSAWAEDQDTCTAVHIARQAEDVAAGPADTLNCILQTRPPIQPVTNEYDIQSDFIDGAALLTTDCGGLYARFADSSNYYTLGVCDDVGNAYRLYKRVATTSTSLATGGTFSSGGTDVIVWKVRKGSLRVLENGVVVISNTDTALTATGTTGLWCGQAQVAGDDCDNNLWFDNYKIINQPRRIYNSWLDNLVPEAKAQKITDPNVKTGRWYVTPVVKVNGVRYPKAATETSLPYTDPETLEAKTRVCPYSAAIGDVDVLDEQALVYINCPKTVTTAYDGITDSTLLYEGDVQVKVETLPTKEKGDLETAVTTNSKEGAVLDETKPISEWIEVVGREINKDFSVGGIDAK